MKHSTIVIYDSRVVLTIKLPIAVIYDRKNVYKIGHRFILCKHIVRLASDVGTLYTNTYFCFSNMKLHLDR